MSFPVLFMLIIETAAMVLVVAPFFFINTSGNTKFLFYLSLHCNDVQFLGDP